MKPFSLSHYRRPLRPQVQDGVPVFNNVAQVVTHVADDRPVHVIYPDLLEQQAAAFLRAFDGRALYAVKCNPDPSVLRVLAASGVRRFDVASIEEIEAVLAVAPGARLYYMHPVKSRKAIAHAWSRGVRDFSLDSAAELSKIVEVVPSPEELTLYVRLGLPKGKAAALDLSGKFGVQGDEAVALLRAVRRVAGRMGVCFHVGSQCMDPAAWAVAITHARKLVDAAGIDIDVLDVGGGFPVNYPGMPSPSLDEISAEIFSAVEAQGFGNTEVICEPGRALVAEAGSVLVKVELRKGDALYLNDGTYGALFDAGVLKWRYPVRRVRGEDDQREDAGSDLTAFTFYGPTCDSADQMDGPFMLPTDMDEGDWIEVGHLGAYGFAMRTRFNGFYSDQTVLVDPDFVSGTQHPPITAVAAGQLDPSLRRF